ncbi:hypothetical protein Golomagni_06614 [Golovinomyces magnicellulatus]|nr:hypothetical protein Golomagni_06614 [Golovinomyces magnicellulatus]
MDGADYHHFHGAASHAPQPYHDPYATLTPGDDRLRPEWDEARYSKDLHSDDAHDATLRPTHYTLGKDDDTGRLGYGRGHRIEATDGLLPDTPPDPSRLNAEQREIMKRFPADLDAPGGGKSGVQAAIDLLKDWKSWFQLKYLHWWIMLVVVIAIVALTTIYHHRAHPRRSGVRHLDRLWHRIARNAAGRDRQLLRVQALPPLHGRELRAQKHPLRLHGRDGARRRILGHVPRTPQRHPRPLYHRRLCHRRHEHLCLHPRRRARAAQTAAHRLPRRSHQELGQRHRGYQEQDHQVRRARHQLRHHRLDRLLAVPEDGKGSTRGECEVEAEAVRALVAGTYAGDRGVQWRAPFLSAAHGWGVPTAFRRG